MHTVTEAPDATRTAVHAWFSREMADALVKSGLVLGNPQAVIASLRQADLGGRPIEALRHHSTPLARQMLREPKKARSEAAAGRLCVARSPHSPGRKAGAFGYPTRRAALRRQMYDLSTDLKVSVPAPKGKDVSFDTRKTWPALDLILEINSTYRRTAWLVMLFSGQRAISVRELRWEMVDLDEGTIRVEGLKNGKNQTFPLAGVVVEALKVLPLREGWVFPAKSKTGYTVDLCELYQGTEMHNGKERPTKALGQHDCRRLHTRAARLEKLVVLCLLGPVRTGFLCDPFLDLFGQQGGRCAGR